MRWRWQEDKAPGTPWDNMAQDEALFVELQRDPSALPVVHIYRWDRPSVSIGRLQSERDVHALFPNLPSVRRPTGGRAVVHGADVTISVIVRDDDLPATEVRGVMSSYRQIVGGLVEAFNQIGVPASLGEPGGKDRRTDAVDCFALAARCDVVEQRTGRKLAGCAQRRQGGVILQQMSIPLSGVVDEAAFRQAAQAGLGRRLGISEWVLVDTPVSV